MGAPDVSIRLLAALIGTVACAAGCGLAPSALFGPRTGTIQGRVLASEPAHAEPPAVVVYLEPLDAGSPGSKTSTATILQAEDGSWPALVAVAAGGRVEFQARGEVRHRFFSSGDPNAFELEQGQAAQLRHEGELRFYCSLHPWESGQIFVTPSPWFATSRASHPYEIRDVPRGRYRLRAWDGRSSQLDRVVDVQGGELTAVDIDFPHDDGS
jgi:plastocyanin